MTINTTELAVILANRVKHTFPAPTPTIKSIQSGTISLPITSTTLVSATATISAVDTSKSIILFNGATGLYQINCSVALTNSTTVTAYGFNGTTGSTSLVRFQVVEFT